MLERQLTIIIQTIIFYYQFFGITVGVKVSEFLGNKISSKISVVIVNWQNWQETNECLNSLSETTYKNLEIIVVDNASSNDSVTHLSRRKEIKLLVSTENRGFGAGQNVGLKYALERGAEYLFILNNDTVVDPNIFEKLLSGFEDPEVGAVAPRIFYAKRKEKIWWTGGFLDLKKGRIINIQSHNLSLFPNGGSCDYLVGCAILVKAEALKKVGVFNEGFFHTGEDVDLSIRLGQVGYRLCVVPDACLWHKVSASGGGDTSPFYLYYLERNRLWLVKKYGDWKGWVSWLRISPLLIKRLVASFVKGQRLTSTKAVMKAWLDFSRGHFGKNFEGK
jgi:GT2 family glycosyltransferase